MGVLALPLSGPSWEPACNYSIQEALVRQLGSSPGWMVPHPAGVRQLDNANWTLVIQPSRRIPAAEGRGPFTPSTGERGAWPLQTGFFQDKNPGSDPFRANSLTQAPKSQVKTGLTRSGLPALVKDQVGCSVLAPKAKIDPPPLVGESLPVDTSSTGHVQCTHPVGDTSNTGRVLPEGSSGARPSSPGLCQPQALSSSNGVQPIPDLSPREEHLALDIPHGVYLAPDVSHTGVHSGTLDTR